MAAQTPAQIILSVSTSLNDQEPGFTYVRWPITELLGYFNEGLYQVSTYRPDAFMATQDFSLIAGATQTLPATMRMLKSIDANGSGSACPGSPIVEYDLNLNRAFYKAPCPQTGTSYRVIGYAYDAKNPLVFYVDPPVPAGTAWSVTATMVQEPLQYTTSTSDPVTGINASIFMDQIYYNGVKFWMLARAYEVDTESNTSNTDSEQFYKKFYALFDIQYKQTSAYNKGAFLGQMGDNQMTKGRTP